MQKYPIKLDYKETEKLKRILTDTTDKRKAKQKAKVILLKSENNDISTIMKITGLSKRTIINYTTQYLNSNNKNTFFHYNSNLNQSELLNYKEIIKDEFNQRPPLTYKEATNRIEKLTGICRSQTQVRNFLNKHNIYTARTKEKIGYKQRYSIICKTKRYKKELLNTKDV